MFKFLKDRKKDNKGFTLVELVIVVAILAILVGLLAPQYTKYVEKSRQSADVDNLEEMVKAVQVYVVDERTEASGTTTLTATITLTKDGVAILAILVGLLAPQYTKYVEKSRKTADANNLEEIVKEIKVVASDPSYAIPQGNFHIVIKDNGGTTITFKPDTNGGTITGKTWTEGMSALLEGTWTVGADAAANTMTNTSLSLKSNKWAATGGIVDGIAAQAHYIGAKIEVKADGTMIVSYDPASIKDGNY